MALLEAEADAIMQFVNNRREGATAPPAAVEINIRESSDSNTPDTPHVPPPVHGSVGLATQPTGSQEGEVVAQGEPSTAEQTGEAVASGETPMETDKPGNSLYNISVVCYILTMLE